MNDYDGDELYNVILFEEKMRKAMSAVHPSNFLLSVSEPGLSSRIGLLKQNYVCIENFMLEDPDSAYYEEV